MTTGYTPPPESVTRMEARSRTSRTARAHITAALLEQLPASLHAPVLDALLQMEALAAADAFQAGYEYEELLKHAYQTGYTDAEQACLSVPETFH